MGPTKAARFKIVLRYYYRIKFDILNLAPPPDTSLHAKAECSVVESTVIAKPTSRGEVT